MTYTSIVQMGQSDSLRQRIAACAAEQGNSQPDVWASSTMLKLSATAAWVSAWDYARSTLTINRNPDMGACDDVITDAMILSAVQALKTAQAGTQGWPA